MSTCRHGQEGALAPPTPSGNVVMSFNALRAMQTRPSDANSVCSVCPSVCQTRDL